jgi:pimeloyl-ACP methyl ester carboxylesterase
MLPSGSSSTLLRRRIGFSLAAFCAIAAAALTTVAPSAAFAQGAKVENRPQVLQALGDGFPIHITYWPALESANPKGLENAPVVILLHGEGGNRLIWDKASAPQGGKAFAEVLQSIGYAVVTVDLRKHGESVVEGQPTMLDGNDYGKMAQGDLGAVKGFLVQEHEQKKLNVRKLGVVASDTMSAVAVQFAELDWAQTPHLDGPGGMPGTPRGQDVQALVLLSPATNAGRLNATRALNVLKAPVFGIAFQVIAGTRDTADRRQAEKVYDVVSSIKQNEERTEFVRPNTNSRGTDLLANPAAKVELKILPFLDKHVKEREWPWATRKSRYERDETDK